jgi:hypothetical protein
MRKVEPVQPKLLNAFLLRKMICEEVTRDTEGLVRDVEVRPDETYEEADHLGIGV